MKWLSKLFKGGSNRGRSGRHHHDPSEESLSWRAPSRAL
ncbi:protein DA1-related 2-like, partial [Trifolium medium]|nr:protein DA1-related 2-like [Trifolium medium]